jgi:thioredoxin 1
MACSSSETDAINKKEVNARSENTDKLILKSNNDNSLNEVKKVSSQVDKVLLPKLLDLGAHKCIPCQKMAPILENLTKEYKGVFDVEFIDVWNPENREKAINYKVQSIPTQIFFDKEGKELWRHVGFMSKEDILKKWKDLGFEFEPAK